MSSLIRKEALAELEPLYGDYFYSGTLEPRDQTERKIRETSLYINDAKKIC